MTSVLVGLSGLEALGKDPQRDPPDGELGEMGDLLMSIGAVLGAVCVANILVVPALASLDRDAAEKLMLWSGLALFGTVSVLALHPPAFFVTVFGLFRPAKFPEWRWYNVGSLLSHSPGNSWNWNTLPASDRSTFF